MCSNYVCGYEVVLCSGVATILSDELCILMENTNHMYIIAHAELYTHNSITIQTVIHYCTHSDCSRPPATT